MMVPLNVSRSTIAAQSRGSVSVFVQPEKDSFETIAMELFSSRFVEDLKEEFGASSVEFHVADFIDHE